MLEYYQWLITAAAFYVLLTTLYNLRYMLRLPPPESAPAEGDSPSPGIEGLRSFPLVSVLIPARDEERNIGECLASLLNQDYPNLEILVLDDDSSDATPAIVKEIAAHHPHVRLISGQPLPPGWHGKAWACHQLSQQARGEWLLFADADTRHQPNAVSAALKVALSHRLDLLSLLPDMALTTFGERLLMAIIPFVFVGCVPHFLFTRSQSAKLAAAIGPFMLFRAETYRKFGGHEAVRRDIVEDVFIARCVKRVGGRIALADGVSVLRVAFYQGWRETWHGLRKSTFPAFNYSLTGLALALAAASAVFLGPYFFVYQAQVNGTTDLIHFGLPSLQILFVCFAAWRIDGRFLIPRHYALLIGLTVFVTVLFSIDSVACCVLGAGTVWKGRTYQFHRT